MLIKDDHSTLSIWAKDKKGKSHDQSMNKRVLLVVLIATSHTSIIIVSEYQNTKNMIFLS